jgi:hypothetical protein
MHVDAPSRSFNLSRVHILRMLYGEVGESSGSLKSVSTSAPHCASWRKRSMRSMVHSHLSRGFRRVRENLAAIATAAYGDAANLLCE